MVSFTLLAITRAGLGLVAFAIAFQTASTAFLLAGASLTIWAAARYIHDQVEHSQLGHMPQHVTSLWRSDQTSDSDLSQQLSQCRFQTSELERQLTAATAEMDKLRIELSAARQASETCGRTEMDKLYGRLGLTRQVPDAFLPFVRRAILLTLHPDQHPHQCKALAEARFVEAMAVMEKILRHRSSRH